ncbi:hypothetical protein [Methanobrevibacter curvatus]|nr:hypothetical protein [Methanobrevibacter curvatus]
MNLTSSGASSSNSVVKWAEITGFSIPFSNSSKSFTVDSLNSSSK